MPSGAFCNLSAYYFAKEPREAWTSSFNSDSTARNTGGAPAKNSLVTLDAIVAANKVSLKNMDKLKESSGDVIDGGNRMLLDFGGFCRFLLTAY